MHKDNIARSERDLAMADNVLEWFRNRFPEQ